MGCAFNHAVLDETSTWHFMSSWAEICRKASPRSALPFLERTKARNTRVKPDLSRPNAVARPDPPLKEKIFKFSESAIDKIESKVNADTPSDGTKPFSTFEALSVHVWRHVTKARNLISGYKSQKTVFTVLVDCRERVKMPETFFGNLTQAIFTDRDAKSLLADDPQSVASLIQKTIKAHNSNAIDKRNKDWENSPKIFQPKDFGVNPVVVESSLSFKVYDVDFGWGKPENVRSGSNNKFDGMIYLYPGKSGGKSIDVELTLEPEAMGRLEKDNEFLYPKKR